MDNKLKQEFRLRATQRMRGAVRDYLLSKHIKSVVLAGGGLLKEFDDLDLYPTQQSQSVFELVANDVLGVKKNDLNAATITIEGKKVQLCKYYKPTLRALVDSFDFTHCQIGVWMNLENNLTAFYCSEGFQRDMALQTTTYTGSDYPLSSLIRIPKVVKKIGLDRRESTNLTISVLANLVKRGFDNYRDFLDQLKAVDVHYIPENTGDLLDIYWALTKDNSKTRKQIEAGLK
jgi:hypothetical protein